MTVSPDKRTSGTAKAQGWAGEERAEDSVHQYRPELEEEVNAADA